MSHETRVSTLRKLINVGQTAIVTAKSENLAEKGWSTKIGTESTRSPNFVASRNTMHTAIKSKVSAHELGGLSKRQMAISDAVLAMTTDAGYSERIAHESTRAMSGDDLAAGTFGSFGAFDYGRDPVVATEYFKRNHAETDLGLTWAINVSAVETQSAATEALYPTITLNPTDTRIIIRTKKTTVTRGILQALLEKDSVADERRNLLDAYTDHRVLEDDGIKIVPYKMKDGANAEFFIKDGLVEDTEVVLGRVPAYPTNWLTFDQREFNMFRLAAHPGIAQQGYDETDEIGPGPSLGQILVSIRSKNQSIDDGQLVALNTLNKRTAMFLVPPEGKGKELVLNFRDAVFSLNGKTRDIKGNPIEAAKELVNANQALRYDIDVNASLHTAGQNSGDLVIRGKNLKVRDIRSLQDGSTVNIKAGSGKTIVDNIVIELVGFKIEATRTNDNRRTQGVQIDPVWETEAFTIRYGTPFLSKGPIGETDDDAERLDELMTAVNVRNDIIALTQTLNYTEQVRETHESIVDDFEDDFSITGLGRLWIRPYYHEADFNLKDVTSLESKDAITNAAAKLRTQMAADISRGVQVSRYLVAARAYIRDNAIRPKIIVLTDEVVATMLLINDPGEVKYFNDVFEYSIYTTQDARWRRIDDETGETVRRMQCFLSLPSEENSYNVLNWGNHFWRPVTVTNINIQRTGAVAKELAVQPCNAHINHCPITFVYNIRGLEQYVLDRLSLSVDLVKDASGEITEDTLDGLNG